MSFKRGAVVLVLFPNSDLATAKRRPAPIVQADNLGTGIGQTVLVLVTSNMARAGHPSRILVPLGSPAATQAGFRTDSVIMTDDLVTVSDTLILRSIGTFPDMQAIDAALKHTLALA